MTEDLTVADLELIAQSLTYTVQAFEAYTDYPSYEFKQDRVQYAKDVLSKVLAIRRQRRNE